MPRQTRTLLHRYGVAMASIVLAALARGLLDPVLGNHLPYVTFFLAVLFTAWYGGLGPSIVAILLGSVTASYLFVPLRGSWAIPERSDQVGLGLYFLVSVAGALFSEALQAARRRSEASAAEAARSHQALQASEARYRQIVETAHEGIWILDAQDRTTFANERMAEILGGTVPDLLGRSAFEFLLPEDRPAWERLLHQEARAEGHLRYRRRDGHVVWLHVRSSPLLDPSGTQPGSLCLATDITERLRADQELQQQREWFRVTLSSIGDAVIVTDVQGRITFLNPVAEHLTAWRSEEAQQQPLETVFRIINEYTRETVDNPVAKVLREGIIVGLANHTLLVARDGTERPIDDSAAPIRDSGGTILGVVLVFRDATAHRQAEQTRRRLAAIIESSNDAIVSKSLDGIITSWNRGAERVYGYPAREVLGKPFSILLPPDRAAEVAETARRLLHGEHLDHFETVRRRKDGTLIDVSVSYSPLRDDAGHRIGTAVIARDISERKRAQAALQSSVERLHLALAAARLGDWSWDAATDLVTFSSRAAEIFGIPPGPHMTWTRMLELLHPEDRERARREVERAVAERSRYDIAYRVQRPDGTQVWVAALGRAHYTASGQPAGMIGIVQDITERKDAEEALRQSEERLRLALDAGRMGVWDWNIRTHLVRWSDNLEPIHGLAPGTFGGTLEAFQQLIHPDDRERVNRAITRCLEERSAYDIEFRNVWPDGSVHWMAGKGKVFTDDAQPTRMVGVGMDITDRKRAELDTRFLADASAALATLVDYESTLQLVARLAVPHFADWTAVDMLDEAGTLRRVAVAHVDPAKVELAHELHRRFPPDPDAPQGVWNIVRTGTSELIPSITDDLLTERVPDPELLDIVRALGLRSYMGVPLSVRGRVLGAITFIAAESGRRYDTTDLAVAEDLAHRAAVAIENARLYGELRQADRRKDEFLSLLAHELRNPLAPIRNALQVLKLAGVNGPVVEQARQMAERQVQSLTRLVDDLLDVSRIMRGKIELRRERVELAQVISRAIETARPAIDAGRHDLVVALPEQPVWIEADVVRLAQVVANLLHNSAKYTDTGGRIELGVTREEGQAVVRVRDTGIGIAPEVLPRVWDLFMQVDASGGRAQGGLGIGLTVVRNLVELHGGAVEAHSAGLGQGSEFVVRLPLAAEPANGPGPARPEGSGRAGASRRLLVVDDNVDAADSLALLLRLHGHEVRVAHDGPSGLREAEAFPPEIAFLDLGMPGMSGYELARRFRAHPALRGVLLVAMTGWGQEQDRRRTKEAGFDHHLVKPVEPETLVRLLTESQPTAG